LDNKVIDIIDARLWPWRLWNYIFLLSRFCPVVFYSSY